MDFAIWSETLSVDIDLIDDQHKVLIQLINDSARVALEKDSKKAKEILKELKSYTDTHFSEEEELFKRSNYPNVDKHLKEHSYFINKLEEFDESLMNSEPSISLNMLEFLKNWLYYHIEIVDNGYALYVKKMMSDA